jgi:uncharacterized protein (DUF1499 family)
MIARIFGWLLALIVVVVAAGLIFFFFIRTDEMMISMFPQGDREEVNFETLQLKESPNQFLVCPTDMCGGQQHLDSTVYQAGAADLKDVFQKFALAAPRTEIVHDDAALNQMDFVQRSELMQYPDWITVKFINLDDGTSTLAIYSRSVYGESDLGINQARIEEWLMNVAGEF